MKKKSRSSPLKRVDSIRAQYESLGVHQYYQTQGAHYLNPHQSQVKALLEQTQSRLNYHSVLDLCCGSGEVSLALSQLGYPLPQGCDPYTQDAYLERTGTSCLEFTFEEIAKGALLSYRYETIICSFALHLCPQSLLYQTVYALFQSAPHLVILSPHKRPNLEQYSDIECFDQGLVHTPIKKKSVRLKAYRLRYSVGNTH